VPRPLAHAELDPVGEQVAQHRVERAQFRELAEDQAHDLLHLFVGVERDDAIRLPPVADGHGHGERAAARLVPPSLRHPLPEDVQRGLGHRALQPRNRRHRMLHFVVRPAR
jgi:hypothetical protein